MNTTTCQNCNTEGATPHIVREVDASERYDGPATVDLCDDCAAITHQLDPMPHVRWWVESALVRA